MQLRSPNDDNILLQWEVPTWLYFWRINLLNRIYYLSIIFASGPAVILILFFSRKYFIPFNIITLSIIMLYFFFYILFLAYIFVSLIFILLSINSTKRQKFCITDKGIYLLQKGTLELIKNFFRSPRYSKYLPGMPGSVITEKIIYKITDEIVKKLPEDIVNYNYTSWENLKQIKADPRSGVIAMREFRTNINIIVGFLVADKEIFSEVMQLISKYAVRAVIK